MINPFLEMAEAVISFKESIEPARSVEKKDSGI